MNIEMLLSSLSQNESGNGLSLDKKIRHIKTMLRDDFNTNVGMQINITGERDTNPINYIEPLINRIALYPNAIFGDNCIRELTSINSPRYIRAALLSKENVELTKEQVDKALCDDDSLIRRTVINRSDVILTSQQIEKCLADDDNVKLCCLFKENLELTPEQVNFGFNNSLEDTLLNRVFHIYRECLHKDINKYSKDDALKNLRYEFNISIGAAIEKNGVNGVNTIAALLSFPHAILSQSFVEKCLESKNESIRASILGRRSTKLTFKQVELVFKQETVNNKMIVLSREDVALTPQQAKECFESTDDLIKAHLLLRNDIELTDKQINEGLLSSKNSPKLSVIFQLYSCENGSLKKLAKKFESFDGLNDTNPLWGTVKKNPSKP